jgi:hypothetical protein
MNISMRGLYDFGTRAFNHLNHACLHLCTAFHHHLGCDVFLVQYMDVIICLECFCYRENYYTPA